MKHKESSDRLYQLCLCGVGLLIPVYQMEKLKHNEVKSLFCHSVEFMTNLLLHWIKKSSSFQGPGCASRRHLQGWAGTGVLSSHFSERVCSLPHTSPQLAAAHIQSCCLPRCQPADSHCPLFPLPWSRSWSGSHGGEQGPDPGPGWAACAENGFPLPPLAHEPPGSPALAGWRQCTWDCVLGTPGETETQASHLGEERPRKH